MKETGATLRWEVVCPTCGYDDYYMIEVFEGYKYRYIRCEKCNNEMKVCPYFINIYELLRNKKGD